MGGPRERPGVRWSGSLASGFVVLALLALLVVPLLMQRSTRALREEIQQAADPARTLITRIQYLLARQTSTLRGYLITADPTHLQLYEVLSEEETRAYRELEPLARRLGPETLARFVELRSLSSYWHSELQDELVATDFTRGGPRPVPFEQELYRETLDAAGRFDHAVVAAMEERRREIRTAEDRALLVQAGLVLVALAAALAAARLGAQVHRLAREAEARRHVAERALEETGRAVEARARLVRGITHDVKNPLGAADGYADLLELGLHGALSPMQAKIVTGIRRSIHGALSIIDDLLEVSRADMGELAISRRPVDLAQLAREVVDEYQGAAHAAGHALELCLAAETAGVHTDPVRVRQVLSNLLSNALKYTPRPGKVTVMLERVAAEAAPRPGRWVAVRVSDTGPGIAPRDHERIFQEFERLPGSGASGHGLGLTIARRLARLLGGELTVESDVGRGSTFSLWLPEREG